MNTQNDLKDELLVSKAEDVVSLSLKRNSPCFLGFLSEHEKQVVLDNVYEAQDDNFFGGYIGAQRTLFGYNTESANDYPIVPIEFLYRKCDELTHRDFLGALMSLGITRECIGDILVSSGRTVVFVKSEISDYILSEIDKVGSKGVKLSVTSTENLPSGNSFEMLSFTLSSLRLDVMVSAVCSLSREKTAKLIKAENVSLNHYIETNVSKNLCEGDTFTIRKYGKFVFTEINGTSRKGKIRVLVKHFR